MNNEYQTTYEIKEYETDNLDHSLGKIMLDSSNGKSNEVIILMYREDIPRVEQNMFLACKDEEKNKLFLLRIKEGTFAVPDYGSHEDALTIKSQLEYKNPPIEYHGISIAKIVCEFTEPGIIKTTSARPTPNSKVFPVPDDELANILNLNGPILLGETIGNQPLNVFIDATKEGGIDHHLGVYGTSGSGKTNTVARLVSQLQSEDVAQIIFDVEGQYRKLNKPLEDPTMVSILGEKGESPQALKSIDVYVAHGSKKPSSDNTHTIPYSLNFSDLPPELFASYLNLSNEGLKTLMQVYTITDVVLSKIENRDPYIGDTDKTGYPGQTFMSFFDILDYCAYRQMFESKVYVNKPIEPPNLKSAQLLGHIEIIKQAYNKYVNKQEMTTWLSLKKSVTQIRQWNIFDIPNVPEPDYNSIIQAGRISIIDFHNLDSTQVQNLALSIIIRKLRVIQQHKFHTGTLDTTLHIVIEEAHQFFSNNATKQIVDEIELIGTRGRKYKCALTLVTLFPDQIDKNVANLMSNHIIHRSSGASIKALKTYASGIPESYWEKIAELSKGEAVIHFPHLLQDAIVAQIYPCPAKLVKAAY